MRSDYVAYMYLNNAHANRNQSNGKWAWNPQVFCRCKSIYCNPFIISRFLRSNRNSQFLSSVKVNHSINLFAFLPGNSLPKAIIPL